MEEKKTCCFLGHRKIATADELREKLYEVIENLITYKYIDTFLFGSKSDFDKLCLAVVTELKDKYPHIQRVYVRAEFQHINDDYKAYLLQSYDDTYYPDQISGSGRAAYVERNQIMIDCSDICIVYYKDGYAPPRRKNSRRDLTDYQPKSGTRIAYEYAQRKKKHIIMINNC
ncbi:MAG: hypothetical protein PUF72_03200 [Clostridiales bacterium]|nr:hypothetical protein [Clostridiales bacterium]